MNPRTAFSASIFDSSSGWRSEGAKTRQHPSSSKRALLSAAVALIGFLGSAAQSQTLPDTEAEIEAALSSAARRAAVAGAPVQRVVVAPGIIDVAGLRVPSRVILVGSGSLGSPTTTLRLRARTTDFAVMVGGGAYGATTGNGIENIIIDGNKANQAPDIYDGDAPKSRPSALVFLCSKCTGRHVKVLNAVYDGIQVSSGYSINISNASAARTGRHGFVTSASVNGVRIQISSAQDTGVAWRALGAGAGFAGDGKKVVFDRVSTARTNGDGVAAYASDNEDMSVTNSIFRTSKNHCVHLGGLRANISGNKCYAPRLVGYFLANDFRAGLEGKRNESGGRVLNNYVEFAGTEGVKVQWYIADTLIKGNTIETTFNDNIAVYDSPQGVTVTENVGRRPATGRNGGVWCHLKSKASNSVVRASTNNFSYSSRTRPEFC
jgi:hypothetical protein